MIPVVNSAPSKVFSIVRQKDGHKVFAALNSSGEPQRVTFTESLHHGRYRDFDDGQAVNVGVGTTVTLAPWSYRLLTAQ